MSEQGYCPNCGPTTIAAPCRCEKCGEVDVLLGIPIHVTAMQEEIAALRADVMPPILHGAARELINQQKERISELEKVAEAGVKASSKFDDPVLRNRLREAGYLKEEG